MITALRKTRIQLKPSIHRFNPLGGANCSPIGLFLLLKFLAGELMGYLGRYLDKDELRSGNIFIK